MCMETAKNKLKINDIVGKKVRLHSSMWVQGYCDGECTSYDSNRGVFYFRTNNHRLDDPTYEVRIGDIGQFELLTS
jgi:hypothetical protein